VALLGIFLTARGDAVSPEYRSTARAAAALAVIAAIGLGANLVGIDAVTAGRPESALLWLLAAIRVVAVVLWLVIGFAAGHDMRQAPVGPLVALGTLDVVANVLYGLAVQQSMLSLAAVLVSLHPIFTVILSRMLLGERLTTSRQAGIAVAVTGVALLST
jgi:drug/metabolite transporter (DMT)-like permease